MNSGSFIDKQSPLNELPESGQSTREQITQNTAARPGETTPLNPPVTKQSGDTKAALIGGKTLLLIEPEPLLRKALSMLIESLGGFSVIAEAGTADEALLAFERSSPDLVLAELS